MGWGSVRGSAVLVATLLVGVVVPAGGPGTRAEAATSAEPTIYVTNQDSGTVTPIAVATNTPGPPIVVGNRPRGVAVTPDGATAYVADFALGGTTVTPIAVATNTAGTPITVGASPAGVAVTPDGATAYVINGLSANVTPIAVATNTPGPPIAVGSAPRGVAITPDGATVYVANSGSSTVTPIAVATNTPGTAIPVGAGPFGVAVTPDGATAYVTNSGSNTVTPIAVATNTPGAAISVGASPRWVAVTPDGATVYVANFNSDNVTPIAVATNIPGTPITVGDGPFGVAVTPDGATAYVANFNSKNVTPIAVATNTPGPPIAVGIGPLGVAVTPDQAPVAALSVSPAPAGAATTFDASASTVAHGTIASYRWDFGDGIPPVTTTTPMTTHVYATPGAYTVTVTETSSAGTSTTQVFTGQTMSRNGGPSAVASATFPVPFASSASIATPGGTVTVTTSVGGLTNLAASPVPASPSPPAGLAFPYGLIGFDIVNLAPGASATITVTLPAPVTAYWKLQNGAWRQLTSATFAGNQVTFTLTDGGGFDADGTANGTIVDPGAPAVAQVPPTTTPPTTTPPTSPTPLSVTPTFTG